MENENRKREQGEIKERWSERERGGKEAVGERKENKSGVER